MRRTYISPEYTRKPCFGTFNSVELPNLFSSKMLEIAEELNLHNQTIVYYQNQLSEQIDFGVESSRPPFSYSAVADKKEKSILVIDPRQNSFERNNSSRWILSINLVELFTNYIFALLKQNRTFEGVRNTMTISNSTDAFIRDYVINNVFNRYKLDRVDLYLKYNDLRRQASLRYQNSWAQNVDTIFLEPLKEIKVETQTSFDYKTIDLKFAQRNNSQSFNFEYYYTVLWKKL